MNNKIIYDIVFLTLSLLAFCFIWVIAGRQDIVSEKRLFFKGTKILIWLSPFLLIVGQIASFIFFGIKPIDFSYGLSSSPLGWILIPISTMISAYIIIKLLIVVFVNKDWIERHFIAIWAALTIMLGAIQSISFYHHIKHHVR